MSLLEEIYTVEIENTTTIKKFVHPLEFVNSEPDIYNAITTAGEGCKFEQGNEKIYRSDVIWVYIMASVRQQCNLYSFGHLLLGYLWELEDFFTKHLQSWISPDDHEGSTAIAPPLPSIDVRT